MSLYRFFQEEIQIPMNRGSPSKNTPESPGDVDDHFGGGSETCYEDWSKRIGKTPELS